MKELAAVLKAMLILRRLDAGDTHAANRDGIIRCARALGVDLQGREAPADDSALAELFDDAVKAAEKSVDDELAWG